MIFICDSLSKNILFNLLDHYKSVFSVALAAGGIACVKYCFAKGCQKYLTRSHTFCARFSHLTPDEILVQCVQHLVQQGWEIPVPIMQFVEYYRIILRRCEG
jgi:hypothetical protein